jgi:hypothetical protein
MLPFLFLFAIPVYVPKKFPGLVENLHHAIQVALITMTALELLKDALLALRTNVDHLIHQLATHPATQIVNALGQGMGVFTAVQTNVPLKEIQILQPASVTLMD